MQGNPHVRFEEEELGGGFVSGEMTPGPNRSAQLGMSASIALVVYKIRRTSPGNA
jgi:hypothetical protein